MFFQDFQCKIDFGSKGVPIHSQPVDLLSRWPKKTESQTRQSQRARQPDQRDRETERADRQRDSQPDRTDGPGGLGRPALVVWFFDRQGRKGGAWRLQRLRSSGGRERREALRASCQGPYVNPVRDSLGGLGKDCRIGLFFFGKNRHILSCCGPFWATNRPSRGYGWPRLLFSWRFGTTNAHFGAKNHGFLAMFWGLHGIHPSTFWS